MKYSAPQYAKALLALVEEAPRHKEREAMRQFFKTLASQGALQLLPEIVREVGEIRQKEKGLRAVSVFAPERESELSIKRKLKFKSAVTLHKDVRLKGGAVVESEGLLVDNSIAMRMRRLRRALIG